METVSLVIAWLLAGFLAALMVVIVVLILTGRIKLDKLISEANGDASLSRFQFLIFTFVIAASFFLIVVGVDPPRLFLGALALIVFYQMVTGRINMHRLLFAKGRVAPDPSTGRRKTLR